MEKLNQWNVEDYPEILSHMEPTYLWQSIQLCSEKMIVFSIIGVGSVGSFEENIGFLSCNIHSYHFSWIVNIIWQSNKLSEANYKTGWKMWANVAHTGHTPTYDRKDHSTHNINDYIVRSSVIPLIPWKNSQWEKIFAILVSDEGFIFTICKEFLNMNKKKATYLVQ